MQLTLSQIENFRNCIKRELQKRKFFYPKWVEEGRMSLQKSDIEIATMEEILDYFNWLQIHTAPQQQKLF